jgi:hypothetical protein
MKVILMNPGDSINLWLAESARADWGKALAYQSGSFTDGRLWLCATADWSSCDVGRGASAKKIDHRRPANTDDAKTAPTSDAIRLGRLSFRLVQRRTSHMPRGDARIAPNEMTRPMRNTTVPPIPLRTRRMRETGLDVTGEAGDPTTIESVIDLF